MSTDYFIRDPAQTVLTLRGDLVIAPRQTAGTLWYLLEDPVRGKFFRVGATEYQLLSSLDGTVTVSEAVARAAARLGSKALSLEEGLVIARWLVESGLGSTPESASSARLATAADRHARRRAATWLNPFVVQLPLLHPADWLNKLLPYGGWVFSGFGLTVWLATCLWALGSAWLDWDRLANTTWIVLDAAGGLRLTAAWIGLKTLHEFSHALACTRYGGRVSHAGIMLLMGAPSAYVDVSSTWRFANPWHRIVVSLAGMYAELFIAALAVLVCTHASPGPWQATCASVAMLASVSTILFNGNPLMRFDAYYALSDLLGIPNLAPRARQELAWFFQRWLCGFDVPRPSHPEGRATVIRLYAVASLAWRLFMFLALSLALIGGLDELGVALSILLALVWFGPPIVRVARDAAALRGTTSISYRRLFIGSSIGILFVAGLAFGLARPAMVTAPAIVEYAPLTTIRTSCAGFVQEICVSSGDRVEQGQTIARLANEELEVELAQMRLACEQAVIRARVDHLNGDIAKEQVEEAKRHSCEQKLAELMHQREGLIVRAPITGHLVARNLDALVGCWLNAGGELALIGTEASKEFIVAVDQDELPLLENHLGQTVDIHIAGESSWLPASLTAVDPRATLDPPHPALSGRLGGPLPVRAETDSKADKPETTYRLLRPCFRGTATATPEINAVLLAGQTATLRFRSSTATLGGQFYAACRRWIQDQLARAKLGLCRKPNRGGS